MERIHSALPSAWCTVDTWRCFSHSNPLHHSCLPCFPFRSLPRPQERTFEHKIKAGAKLGSCGQSRSLTGMTPGLVTAWKKRKGLPPEALVASASPSVRDSWSWGHFRLLLIGLLVCKTHPLTLLHLIVPITTSQLMFPSFYRWAKWGFAMGKKWAHQPRGKSESELEPSHILFL